MEKFFSELYRKKGLLLLVEGEWKRNWAGTAHVLGWTLFTHRRPPHFPNIEGAREKSNKKSAPGWMNGERGGGKAVDRKLKYQKKILIYCIWHIIQLVLSFCCSLTLSFFVYKTTVWRTVCGKKHRAPVGWMELHHRVYMPPSTLYITVFESMFSVLHHPKQKSEEEKIRKKGAWEGRHTKRRGKIVIIDNFMVRNDTTTWEWSET